LKIEKQQGFQLGKWRVYPDQGLLVDGDLQSHLEPKVMEVLIYLAERQDEVVRRDDLIKSIWNGTFVSDEVLSRAISVLRTHLGDDRMTPYYIQTLPKVGYRLLMTVTPISESVSDAKSDSKTAAINRRTEKWTFVVSITVIVIAVIVLMTKQKVEIDPRSPAAFSSISDWFDFLVVEKEGVTGITSIAVLPFDNLSENKESSYFSEGLTDELTMSLSRVKGLKVVARRSSYSFKDRIDDVPTIGRLLNADAIFEGSIRRNGDQLHINAQLCDVSDGYLIWSGIFERNVSDVFDVQEEIAMDVVEAMREHFDDANLQTTQINQTPPDMEAYAFYLNSGNYLWKLRGEQPLRQSMELYKRALNLDPDFSRAYIGLANALVLLPFYSSEPMEPMFIEALEVLASHTFTNNRDLGEAQALYAFIAWNRWKWIKAEEHFRQALELAPDSPNIYQWYSSYLSYVGRNQDGLLAAKRARELDEISPAINDRLGIAYLWVNENVRAAEHFAIGAQLGFRNAINPGYLIFLLRERRFFEFSSVMAALHRDSENPPDWLIDNAETTFLIENRDTSLAMAMQAKQEGNFARPFIEFGVWIAMGGIDQAYETFYAWRYSAPQYLPLEFIFSEEGREFREDSRFEQLAEDIGWKEYWQTFGEPDMYK
jgi:TolB-like protein/DNA-binding winged helix-turn-helix (wHTH) protein